MTLGRGVKVDLGCLIFTEHRAVWTFLHQEGSPDVSNWSRNQLCVSVIGVGINRLAGELWKTDYRPLMSNPHLTGKKEFLNIHSGTGETLGRPVFALNVTSNIPKNSGNILCYLSLPSV